ncbi:MAG: hypothetical protein K6L81_09085 [Agarilytica sp.]
MNKWKIAFFICLPLTVLSLLFSFYVVIDNGVSYTYLEVSYDDQVRANEVLGDLIVQGGQQYSQQDFLHLLRQAYPEAFIVEEGTVIRMDSNIFEFQNNKLINAR